MSCSSGVFDTASPVESCVESVGVAVSPVIAVSVPVVSGGVGGESPVFVVAVESGIPEGWKLSHPLGNQKSLYCQRHLPYL